MLFEVLAVVALPLLAWAVMLGFMLLSAFVPGGRWWFLGGCLGALWALGFGYFNDFFPSVLAAFMLLAVLITGASFEVRWLDRRGLEVTCTVLESKRVEETVPVQGPAGGGGGTYISYGYRLACPGGRPTAMTTSDRVGREGQPLQVVYDPGNRIAPRPASEVGPVEWVDVLMPVLIVVGVGLTLFRNRCGRPRSAVRRG